jgi:hypothetical protein
LQETIEWYLSSDTLLGFASLVIDDGAALPAAGDRVTREMQEGSLEAHAEHVLYSRVSPAQLLALVASVFQLSQGRALPTAFRP